GGYAHSALCGAFWRHELLATDRAALPGLPGRAGGWCRDAGMTVDAPHHATGAGNIDAAVELVARHYASFVDRGQLATVLGWLDALPESVAAADWLICFAGSVVSAHAGRLDEAERWLQLAVAAPPLVREGQEPAAPLASLRGYLRLLRGDLGGTVANARRALAAAPAGDELWTLGTQMLLVSGLWWTGEAGEAKAALGTVRRTAHAAGIPAMV